tara:strand:+ start:1155 stop:1454 length:300 start_codon:yes stop_codon:yes gene_type:complete
MSTTPKNIGVQGSMSNLSVTASSVVDAPSINEHTNLVFVDIQDNDVYVTFDGSTPSASVGHILKAGRDYLFYAGMFKTAKLLGKGSTAVVALTQLNGYA